MRTRRHVAVLWLAALACGLVAAAPRARAVAPAVDAAAPPFVAQTPAGERFDLAQLRGKVVLLHFWATWCDSCRTEMPALAHIYADLHAHGLELLTVSADDPHERRAAIDMARLHGLPAAVLDAARPNGFGAPPVLPLTYVIDRGGVLRARLLPARAPLTEARLRAVLTPLLDAAPPQPASGQ
jgi:cytochrome c biogenesis protein CcmG/thiol:disulfide interchange protein DsbE